MYYSPAQPTPTLFDPAPPVGPQHYTTKRRIAWWIVALPVLAIAGGTYAWQLDNRPNSPTAAVAQTTPIPTQHPQVAGVSFGDIMKKTPSYVGWLAGVSRGRIVMVQPDSGSLNTLTEAPNEWYGPISTLVWSPDHTKIAYLAIPDADRDGLAKDAAGFSQHMGLPAITTPDAFPFGTVTILDVTTKQVTKTPLEARNTPKSVIWIDTQTLATVGQTLSTYSLADGSTKTLTVAGATNPDELLQSPLAWQASTQTLYYTKVKKGDTESVRLAMALHMANNQVEELVPLKTGLFDDVTNSQNVDFALSDDGQRLAMVTQDGLTYRTLADGGMHPLPYNDSWIWLKTSTVSDLEWLTPAKLAFSSLADDGSRVWGVWDIPSTTLNTFGKGALDGSWDVSTGRLALVMADHAHIGFLTPNWQNQDASAMKSLPLDWDKVSW